ncbi:putative tRNA 2'-phosphotransferase [Symbiodinium microadriaticum]|uniref:2'-phosphotransferase n=1 Tax=Symbiodinium microadriaticum TaxID=2951 RepID=A0A1Q9DHD2_SYMMI|nr:putative tRNA 2'-phosphotransferase [Symbiodinium microadriaticum]
MGRAHYRPDGTRRRTRGELEARAKKKAERERVAAEAAAAADDADRAGDRDAAAAAPYEGAEAGDEEEQIEVEVEVEEEEAIEEVPVRRPLPRLRPAPKWGAAPARERSRSPRRMAISSDRLFRLSKALTSLLRHRAAAEGLPLRGDGFFEVEAVTRTRAMRSLGASSDEVVYAAQQDAKRRYTLQYHSGIPWIRAAQGHSQAVQKDLVMRRLRQHELPPFVYHGTRSWCYQSIRRAGLLAGGPSGSRTDIHLVENFPESGRVLSGWRASCEIAIQVDTRRAAAGGSTFFVSDNDVFITEGVDGVLSPAFISAVVILASGEVITSPRVGTAPSGEAVVGTSLCQWSTRNQDLLSPLTPTAPNGVAEPARGTPLWSPGDDDSEDHPLLSTPSAHGLTTPAGGTPLWSPSVDELEDILPSSPPPPPPRQAAPRALTQPSQATSARGTPVGGLMSRTLRREDYAPEILRVVEPVLNQDKSDVTANHDDSSTTEVQPTRPGGVKTALTEVPSSSMTALPAPDRLPRVNWAENEVFHFNPEAADLLFHITPERRTAGELAKRAAKAAARAAAAAADAAGGGVAKPAVPAVAKEGAPAGPPAKATASVTTASLRVPPAPTSTSTSSTVDASTSVPKSEPVPTAYPSIAAAPKPGGGEHRTWLPALPALRVKAPPPHLQAEAAENAPEAPAKAPSPKRTAEAATLAPDVAPDETDDLKTSTAEPEQTLIPTAPSGEPPRLDPTQLPPAPPPPRRSKRSRTQPPRQIPAADHAQTKWSQVTTLESMLEDLREADVATMLSLFQQAGHYATHHGPFHDLRDSLMHAQVCGPNGEPLPLPPVGNWILALGISLLGYDTLAGRELLTRLTNPQTVGDLTEAWAFQLWNRGHKSLCTQLSGFFMLLHNLLEDVPARVYSVLGQEWRLTWMEFRAVVRAWIGDPPTQTMLAITQVPETETAHGRFGRLSETLRARSLSPDYGPLLGSRTSFLDNTVDANAIPSILLPYTFPAFQAGLALPLSLQDQDQSECAYMFAWMTLQVWLLAAISIFMLLRCSRRYATTCFERIDARLMVVPGARHYPVLVNIPAVHYQSPAKLPEDARIRAPRYQLDQPPDKVQAFCAHLAHTLSDPPTPSDLDRALQQAAAQHLIPVQPLTKFDSAADRVTGVVKHMWNLRHTAQQFAIEVLRPFTLAAQIRHWQGTGERLWFSLGQLFSAWRHQVPHLTEALSLLPARKATPSHLAQLSLWHLGKDVLLPHLAVLCDQLWQSPHAFHQLWADAWIAWLAKPGKAPDQPENLRPISLTEGGGRIVVKALTLQLRPSLTEATQSWPQYAYVPGRSIEHAIIRALHHCDRVNTTVASQRVTLRERRATGRVPTACCGGVTLSIDTSKAFDTVDRGVLESELKTARVPEPELTLILSLHRNIGYWPAGPTSDVRVSSERGVRQGCPLAPSLWTLVTVALLRTMADTESLHWIQHNATMFADDLLLQWEYHSVSELERMISAIQHCFQVLARLGLQVQHRKTQLLVAQQGRLAHKWWKAHTASTKEGRFLRIPQPNHKDLHLPIVPQLTYLGIVLSYVDAATATVEHRLHVAEAQRARLLKVLHSRTLPLHKRVQLWLACVRSSALYGLHLLDLKQKHVARITITLVRHLRAIARSFAHMSQETSQALLLRLNVEDPLSFLLRASQKLLIKTLHSQDPMVHQSCILQWLTRTTESRLALDSHVVHAFPPGEDSGSAATALDEEISESLRIASLPPPLVGAQLPEVQAKLRHVFAAWCRLLEPPVESLDQHSFSAQLRLTRPPSPRPPICLFLPPIMTHVIEQMELDAEEMDCFGSLLGKRPLALDIGEPQAKFPHQSGKGHPPQRSSRQRPLPPQRNSRQTAPFQGSRTQEDNRGKSGTSSDQLLHKVAKALIVQSDYLSRLQSDHTVLFTFRNGDGPQLMVPLLHEVTANWRDQRSKGKVTKSLKQTLLQYVTSEIITRVSTFAEDKNAQAKAQEMGWVTSDLEYNYLDWNAEEQRLVPRQEGTLTPLQVLTDAKRLKTLLKEQELIIKFAAARNAQPNSASETATFVLELSLQIPAAAEAMAIFRKWFASSALLLLSLRLKPARPERSPLIKEIQEDTPPGERRIAELPAWRLAPFRVPKLPVGKNPIRLPCKALQKVSCIWGHSLNLDIIDLS